MKQALIAATLSFFIVSCASTEEATIPANQFLNLTAEEDADEVEQYWQVKNRAAPMYPPEAARNRVNGCVDLIFGIGSDGTVEGYRVESSYPQGVFDDYAAAALMKWTYEAAPENSERIPVLTHVQLYFTVEDSGPDPKYDANCKDEENS